jgi:PAS domain S-box-containing protein
MEQLGDTDSLFEHILHGLTDSVLLISKDLKILWANKAFINQTGYAPEEIIGKHCFAITHHNENPCMSPDDICPISDSLRTGETITTTHTHYDKDGNKIFVEVSAHPMRNTNGEIVQFGYFLRDLTEPKQNERRINATNALLQLYIKKSSRKEYLDSVVDLICNWSSCCCVGIRVLDTYGKIPFESYVGYSKEFWDSENWLSVQEDQCACVRVIQGKHELQDLPAMTPEGSFRLNNATEFFRTLAEEGKGRYRGVCLQSGFKSLAIIPIRYQGSVIGAIHIADEQEDMVPLKTVEFIESISPLIGEAVHRFSTEEELMKYQYHLEEMVEERTGMLEAATRKLQQEIAEHKIAAEEVIHAKTYLESMLNNSMDLIITIKRDGTISYVNPQLGDITGYRLEDVKGKHFLEFIPENAKENVLEKWEEIKKGIPSKYETLIMKADKTPIYCLVSQSLVEGFDEILVSLKDITLRKIMEEALFKSYSEMETRVKERTAELEKVNRELMNEIAERKRMEESLQQSKASLNEAQRIAHLGNWDWNIQTDQLQWSDEIYRIFGLSPQQFGATYEAFLNSVHPEDRGFIDSAVHEALSGNKPYSIDHRIVLPDGTVRIVHEQAEVTFHETGKPIRMIGTVQDITDSKRAEEELKESYEQLRKLSAHLQSVREEERTNIARDIHDDLGQALTALKIEVSMLANKLRPDNKFLDKAESIIKKIDDSIQSVKRICTELRPAILDHFGLSAAIEWNIEQFENQTGIKCDVSLEPREIVLDQDLTISIFRIFQEALTNVVRHADASAVWINLRLRDGKIMLEIRDNGKGIAEKHFLDSKSFGIMGIRERVHFFGGNVKISSTKDKGTAIMVSIPLRKKDGP